MRDIKFRIWIPEAKIKYEGDMYYQDSQYLSSFLSRVYAQFQTTHPSYLPFQVEDRLMQYTGLHDKNGKEIYEGDIIKSQPTPWLTVPNVLMKVFWWSDEYSDWDARFAFRDINIPAQSWISTRDLRDSKLWPIEVIGNIYENPELLALSPERKQTEVKE